MKYKLFALATIIFGITSAFYIFTKLKIDVSDLIITLEDTE